MSACTVLEDTTGRKKKGKITILMYLLVKFLLLGHPYKESASVLYIVAIAVRQILYCYYVTTKLIRVKGFYNNNNLSNNN